VVAADHDMPGHPGIKLTCEKCKLHYPIEAREKMGCFQDQVKKIVDKGKVTMHRCPWAVLHEAGTGGNLNYAFSSFDLRKTEPFSTQHAMLVDAWGEISRVTGQLRDHRMKKAEENR